jgi:hypothetical protein
VRTNLLNFAGANARSHFLQHLRRG